MKKSMISKLVVLVVVMVVAGGFAFGATDSVDLNGEVAAISSVAFAAGGETFNAGVVSFSIAYDQATTITDLVDVEAVSNFNTGYVVNVDYGVLTAQDAEATVGSTISYALTLEGVELADGGAIFDVAGTTASSIKTLGLSIDAPATGTYYAAGTYEDTVTVTLSAK